MEKYFPNIVDIHFTAEMENKLDEIASGNVEWVKMLDEFFKPFIKTIKDAETNIIGGLNILENCRKYNVKKLVYSDAIA